MYPAKSFYRPKGWGIRFDYPPLLLHDPLQTLPSRFEAIYFHFKCFFIRVSKSFFPVKYSTDLVYETLKDAKLPESVGNQNKLVPSGCHPINQLISTNVNQDVMNLYAQVDKSKIVKNRASGGSRYTSTLSGKNARLMLNWKKNTNHVPNWFILFKQIISHVSLYQSPRFELETVG